MLLKDLAEAARPCPPAKSSREETGRILTPLAKGRWRSPLAGAPGEMVTNGGRMTFYALHPKEVWTLAMMPGILLAQFTIPVQHLLPSRS